MKFWQIFLGLLLTSCAANVISAHGFLWVEDANRPICYDYLWLKETPAQVQKVCNSTHALDYALGCTLPSTCVILSMYDEDTAKRIFLSGTDWSHRDHEVIGHVFNRWSHP